MPHFEDGDFRNAEPLRKFSQGDQGLGADYAHVVLGELGAVVLFTTRIGPEGAWTSHGKQT